MDKTEEQIDKEIDSIYAEMESAYTDEKYEECLGLIQRLKEEYSDRVDQTNLQEWIGTCYYRKKDYVMAAMNLELALGRMRQNGDSEDEMFHAECALGISHFFLHNHAEAALHLRAVLARAPEFKCEEDRVSHFWVHIYYCRSLYQTQKPMEAIEMLLKARKYLLASKDFGKDDESKKRLAIVEFDLGKVYSYVRESEKSRQFLESISLKVLPTNYHSYYHVYLGMSFYLEKKFESAVIEYQMSLEIGVPTEHKAEAHFIVGYCFHSKSELANAREHFKMCLESETASPEFHEYARQGLSKIKKAMTDEMN